MTIKIVSVNKNNVFEWRNAVRRVFGDISKESDVERLVKDRLMIQINEESLVVLRHGALQCSCL